MPGPTLTAAELAAELGRPAAWLYANRDRLQAREKMPAPLHGGAQPLTWSRAQIVAWLDRALTPQQRIAAAAFRAAAAAAATTALVSDTSLEEDAARIKLDRIYAPQGQQ